MFNRPDPTKVVEKIQRQSQEQKELFRIAINPTPAEKFKIAADNSAMFQSSRREPTKEECAALNSKSKEVGLSQKEEFHAHMEFLKELKKPAGIVKANERPNPGIVVENVQRKSQEKDEALRRAFNPTPEEKVKQRADNEAVFQAARREPTQEERAALDSKSKEVGLSQHETMRAHIEFRKELKNPVGLINNSSMYQSEKNNGAAESSIGNQESCVVS